MKKTLQNNYARIGLLGIGILLTGILLTSMVYRGKLGERYQPLNHFVSELGEVGISQWAGLFNGCLVVSSVCFVIFLLGLTQRMGGWLGGLLGVVGVALSVFGMMVGFVPMNHLQPHIFWAMGFFNLGLVFISLFSAALVWGKYNLPKSLILPGGLAWLAFASFLFVLRFSQSSTGTAPLAEIIQKLAQPRPMVWTLALMEWLAVGSILLWILWVAWVMHRQGSAQ
ncbi:MAG TPA: DUF998 domain-containing protein [Anaerolineales bacterium]|nr:DUF998 domain-containing protein [Anaerolineales bacterium]